MIKFSIVITTYQRNDGTTPKVLKRALDSVFNQDYDNFKIYVIGDKYDNNSEFESIFQEYPKDKIYYENLDGEYLEQAYDFAMLIPGFSGHGFKAFDKLGNDITEKLFAPNGLMKVDADYTLKPFEQWSIKDWPETYQNPSYPNIFAPGIAFAPPHSISKPMKSKNGTPIFASAPRTGMPSGIMGKVTADNIINWIQTGNSTMQHKASMGRMGAACIVSAGYGMRKGTAATMTVSPVVPDWDKYPDWGRDIKTTMGEPGLAGHWLKWLMHYMFLYKAKGKPFWWLIPE